MNLFGFFKSTKQTATSAPQARERLQILLAHERAAIGDSDLVTKLREDILSAVAKHIDIDRDKVEVKMERGEDVSMLEIDIEIPKKTSIKVKAA